MIVVDVETTGLNPERNSIVSIGAVEFERPSNQFYQECRPWVGADISEEALKVNGFTLEQLSDPSRPSLYKTIGEFIDWVDSCGELTLAGHNLSVFDALFLKSSMRIYNLGDKWPFGRRTVDSHSVCYCDYIRRGVVLPVGRRRSGISLDVALNYVGIPDEPRPHNALTGAKCAAEVIHRISRGCGLFSEYSHFELPDYLRKGL